MTLLLLSIPMAIIVHGWLTRTRPMPVSQDITDFCQALITYGADVKARLDNAAADKAAALDTLTAQLTQDHADEIAALKTALAQVQGG